MLRVPDEIHARLRAAAEDRKTTVTALLLDPWRTGATVTLAGRDAHGEPVAETVPLTIPTPTSLFGRKPKKQPTPQALALKAALVEAIEAKTGKPAPTPTKGASKHAVQPVVRIRGRQRLVGVDPQTGEAIYR